MEDNNRKRQGYCAYFQMFIKMEDDGKVHPCGTCIIKCPKSEGKERNFFIE